MKLTSNMRLTRTQITRMGKEDAKEYLHTVHAQNGISTDLRGLKVPIMKANIRALNGYS